jgi:hypothetical protein
MTVATRRLVVAGVALILASLVGGVVSVVADENSWGGAWSSEATLAAPWPMLLLQGLATVGAASRRRGFAIAGAAVLFLSAAVAGISGFFDGQLGRSDLAASYVVMQVVYVVVAAATAVLAALRLRELFTRTEAVAADAH